MKYSNYQLFYSLKAIKRLFTIYFNHSLSKSSNNRRSPERISWRIKQNATKTHYFPNKGFRRGYAQKFIVNFRRLPDSYAIIYFPDEVEEIEYQNISVDNFVYYNFSTEKIL
jgi:hypothetical protein